MSRTLNGQKGDTRGSSAHDAGLPASLGVAAAARRSMEVVYGERLREARRTPRTLGAAVHGRPLGWRLCGR